MSEKYKEADRIDGRMDIGLYPYYIYQHTIIEPRILFDIGAWNSDDADRLKVWFNIDEKNVYCIEPNEANFSIMTASHPNFNNFHMAISNYTGTGSFLCHREAGDISSLHKMIGVKEDIYDKKNINVFRMDDFIVNHNISEISICKIDVEGKSYELLEGFGDKLHVLKSLQIEAELKPLYDGQKKLYGDVEVFLSSNGFTMLEYCDTHIPGQCDTIWVQNKYLK